jgi:hypothetical protein
MKGWLDKYNDGGPVQPNYNDYSVSAGPGFEGDGYSNVGRNYSPAWGGQFQDGGKICDSCQKAEDGDKLSARRKAVLAKAEQVFNSKDLPYTIPEDIVKSGGNSNYVCIQGVCGILTDAGIIPKDYYTNTKFAEKAPGMGFGRAMADLKLMKPGDVIQHLSDTNAEGTRFPSHAEIFKGTNDSGDYEFYDYFDKFNGLGNIRTYSKEELEDRFSRFKNKDNSRTQAQFFSLDPEELPKTAPRPFPYDLPNKEQEDYFNATHAADTKYYPGEAAQGPISDIDSYKRSLMKHELAGLFNDKKLDEQLRKELKISDQDLQKAKPLIYGIMDQESDFGNPKSLKRDIKYGLKELLGSGKYSMGPAAVRYDDALSSQTKQAFGIDSPHDLSNTKNAYIGALDVLHKGSLYTDDKVSGHPGIQDKDSMERALYWYNNPKNIVNSDAQTFQAISKDANNLFPWQDKQELMSKAYNSPLEMSEGSYPDKVLEQSKGLHQVINFDDMNVLPEVQVKDRRIYNEEPFKDGGPVKRFMQPTETFKNLGYNSKTNGMSTELSTSVGGPGEVYLVPGYRQGKILQDPEGVFNAYGEHLGGPFKTVQAAEDFGKLRHKYVEQNKDIPAPFKTRDYAMGGSIGGATQGIPGATGFMYARTGTIPSNGKYAKKTKASAQNGKYFPKGVPGENEPLQFDPEDDAPFMMFGKLYEEPDRSREFPSFVPAMPAEELHPIDININQRNLLAEHTFTHQPGMKYDENLEGAASDNYMLKRTVTPYVKDEDIRLNTQVPTNPRDINFISNYKGAIGEVDQYPTSVPYQGEKHWNIDRFVIDPQFSTGYSSLENFDEDTDKAQQRRNTLADMYKYFMLQNKGDKDTSWKQANEFMTKEIDPRISGPVYNTLRGDETLSRLPKSITAMVDEDYLRNFNSLKNEANLPDSERSEVGRDFLKHPASDKQAKDLAMDWLINYKKMSPKQAEQYYNKLPKTNEEYYKNLIKKEGKSKNNKRTITVLDSKEMQNGGEMKFYQEGLDFKPKSISKNGSKVIKDDRGQWDHPGEITEIGSNQITMQGVPYPVMGISDTGDMQMMYPNQEYQYDGNSVTEYPMMAQGGQLTKLDQLTNFTNYNTKQPGGWLDKYQ